MWSRFPHGKEQFWCETGGPLWSIGALCRETCKNVWTDQYAMWVVGSDGLKEPCIRWGPDPAIWRSSFYGKEPALACPTTLCRELWKNDWMIEQPFGIWTRMGPRKHVLGGVHTGATWRMPLNHPCVAAMWPVVKLLWPLLCGLLSLIFCRLVWWCEQRVL